MTGKYTAEQFELKLFPFQVAPLQATKCLICNRECGGHYCEYHREIRDDSWEAMQETEREFSQW